MYKTIIKGKFIDLAANHRMSDQPKHIEIAMYQILWLYFTMILETMNTPFIKTLKWYKI